MDYVKVLKDIISIDTSDPPGWNYDKVVDYLRPLFEEVGFETQKIHIPEELSLIHISEPTRPY